MSIFANKKIWKRIAIVIGIIALIGVVFPRPSSAASIGGILINGIMDLFVGIADGIQTIIHKIFVQQELVIYMISEGINWYGIALGILTGIVLVASGVISLSFVITAGVIVLALNMFGVGEVLFNTTKAITTSMLADDTIALPTITLTPYEIFTNEEGLFSVDFFTKNDKQSDIDGNNISLNQNISDWYVTLRLIAIVGMMSVLVYMGIRILLSSTAESAAKYKKMLWDWTVAIFLMFTMQYIMVFSNFLVNALVDTIGTIKVESGATNKETGKSIGTITKQGVEGYIIGASVNGDSLTIDTDTTNLVKQAYKELVNNGQGNAQSDFEDNFYQDEGLTTKASGEGNAKILFWPADNFATQARMNAQFVRNSDGGEIADYIGYSLIYVALTIYTVMFIFVYIKRYIYMVFLTLISPLVALTYPIDKVKDGQAQAFNFWFREYLYNLLLQPLHLILYMLLIGSAMRFAANNPLYVIVALGFMLPAEKLLKAMFGFKGQTPGSMPGLAAGALMMHATRSLFGKGPKGGPGNSKGGLGNSGNSDKINFNTDKGDGYSDRGIFGDPNENQESGDDEELDEQGQAMQFLKDNTEEADTFDHTRVSTQSGNNRIHSTSAHTSTATNSQVNAANTSNSNDDEGIGWLQASGRALKNKAKGTLGDVNWWKNTGTSVARKAAGLGIGAIGATAGGIAGMISGDASKAAENMAVGGLAGYKFGSAGGEGLGPLVGGAVSAVRDEYYNANPNKYTKKMQDEYVKNFKKDNENMRVIERNIRDKDQYNEMLENGIGEYAQYGITDVKDMVAVEQFYNSNKREFKTRKQAINIMQMKKKVAGGNLKDLHSTEKAKWRKDMIEKFEKQGGYSKEKAEENADKAFGYFEKLDSIKGSIF